MSFFFFFFLNVFSVSIVFSRLTLGKKNMFHLYSHIHEKYMHVSVEMTVEIRNKCTIS